MTMVLPKHTSFPALGHAHTRTWAQNINSKTPGKKATYERSKLYKNNVLKGGDICHFPLAITAVKTLTSVVVFF